jgi:hypothetical protein
VFLLLAPLCSVPAFAGLFDLLVGAIKSFCFPQPLTIAREIDYLESIGQHQGSTVGIHAGSNGYDGHDRTQRSANGNTPVLLFASGPLQAKIDNPLNTGEQRRHSPPSTHAEL